MTFVVTLQRLVFSVYIIYSNMNCMYQRNILVVTQLRTFIQKRSLYYKCLPNQDFAHSVKKTCALRTIVTLGRCIAER